ncbi:MAG: DNA adenine methylase [Nanoarchaeota archaeon]|nr:DNA adenine methylase [Nanoarchaeota archaeon]
MQKTVTKELSKGYEKNIAGKTIKVEEGVFWIQKQRQKHSLHHITPYQASFAPQIPEFFIKNYSTRGNKVLDPFAGRGTTILEANISGRIGIGFDISPLAIQIAKAKLKNITYEEIEKRLYEIDFSKEILNGYDEFKYIYHHKTYSQIMNLKKQLGNNRTDTFIKAIILCRLHGHSPSFFSVFTFNVISPSAKAIRKMSERHHSKPEFRDVVPRILKKAKTVLRDSIIEQKESYVKIANSNKLPLKNNSIDMIITSPPFLAAINYIDDNWLRFWFLGYEKENLRKTLIQTNNMEDYKKFIKSSMNEMHRVLKSKKYCIIEVGDVGNNGKRVNLEELIIELASETGFEVEKILINHISAPKISKAFSKNAKNKGTKTNRCVIMKKYDNKLND